MGESLMPPEAPPPRPLRTAVPVRLARRFSAPLPAALLFCALGLFAAIVVVATNRMLAARPLLPPSAFAPLPSAGSSVPPPSTPTGAALGCTSSQTAAGSLDGLTLSADATVLLVVKGETIVVTVPSGARLGGDTTSPTATVTGAHSKTKAMTGAVVQDVALCASGPSGDVTVTVPAGTGATASVSAGPAGLTAVRFRAAPASSGSNSSGGDEGG